MYRPLRAFTQVGVVLVACGLTLVALRALPWPATASGVTLVVGGACIVLGLQAVIVGIVGDAIASNRKLIEEGLYRARSTAISEPEGPGVTGGQAAAGPTDEAAEGDDRGRGGER
jgi:hypothetical protein